MSDKLIKPNSPPIKVLFKSALSKITQYGVLLIEMQKGAIPEATISKYNKKINLNYYTAYNNNIIGCNFLDIHGACIIDIDTTKTTIMINKIPAYNFWKDVYNMIQEFRLMFCVECHGCGDAWLHFPGKRCNGCRCAQNLDVATEFNILMEETFGTNKI